MKNDKVRVLYIAGMGRSGSTILDNILGQNDGFFSAGELSDIWDRGLLEGRTCSCGVPVKGCDVWSAILEETLEGTDQIAPQEMVQLRERGARTRHIPLTLVPFGRLLLRHRLRKYLGGLDRLYHAIRSRTGCKVIVDSSKFPSYGILLDMIPTIDLHVVHLVRDPRAVAYSWGRKRLVDPDPANPMYIPQFGPVASSIRWVIRNLATELFWRRFSERYLLVRYEDFVSEPQDTVKHILDLVQAELSPTLFVTSRKVNLGGNHAVWGNPSRFLTGVVDLRLDDQWEMEIKKSVRNIVTALTWPLLLRYGYLGKRAAQQT
jgi:hypothetical protein